MKIVFEKLRYKNMLSTGNVFTTIDLNKRSMTLVIGTNGAGKSTMIDALTFVLFGKPFRNINKGNLINSINNSDHLVELELSIGAKKYLIRRGQKPTIFEIYCNGVLVNQDAASRDYQKYLERNVLGFNLKSFTQIVVIGSSSFTPFMRLVANDRRAIIEDLLDIEIFTSMNKIIKGRMDGLKDALSENAADINRVISNIDLQKKYIAESKKNTAEVLEKKKVEIDLNCNHIDKLKAEIAENLQFIQQQRETIQDEIEITSKIRKLEEYRIQIEANLKTKNKDLEFYTDNHICPKCQQDINNKEAMIDACQKAIGLIQNGLTKLQLDQETLETRLTAISSTKTLISDRVAKNTALQASIDQIQKYIDGLLGEAEKLSTAAPISEDILHVSKQLYSDLERLNNAKKASLDQKNYYDMAVSLLKDNGIKAKIIKQYLPVINGLVNKYLESLEFFVNFNINEEFKETIKSRHRDDFSYENFSEGEKLRIDLALLFTWRAVAKLKNSMNTNLLILDEVFDGSLDNTGTEEFMKLLQTFSSEANIFLISHRGDILQDRFNHVLKFEKINNFSEVV